MSEELRIGTEIVFNITYLVIVWGVVVLMIVRFSAVATGNKPVAKILVWAFALLALGDTGHVGFRVIAYFRGGLATNPELVGVGALSTAVTVTIFYMLMVFIWQIRFKKSPGWFGWLILVAGLIRLIILAFPQNQWEALVPPYGWSLLRNSLLMVQGLGVMFLILRDSRVAGDSTFRWIGWMIALSYLFYTPVIMWSAAVPLLGMLMIPKTCAYVAIAVIVYRSLWGGNQKIESRSFVSDLP